jgi:hypothetical protein
MADALKKFANQNPTPDTVNLDNLGEIHPHFDGESCWERSHPTFISRKRKVILTCPRKVGHSSLRFYLHAQNEMYDDDWIWIEDEHRNPKSWLTPEEYYEVVSQVYSEGTRAIVCKQKLPHHNETNPHIKSANLMMMKSPECKEHFGDYNKWDYANSVAPEWCSRKEFDMCPPFQTLPFFEDWTSYLIVRDPMDRFISGLITEMDNGMSSPWIFDSLAHTEKGWERYYNSAKRMLYFTDPEWLLMGGMDGIQMNHTFILSRPMWKGQTMYDGYDKLIHYKHDIDYAKDSSGQLVATTESMKKSRGIIHSLEDLGFIGEMVAKTLHEADTEQGNQHSHTHMNITPPLRQAVLNELKDDEDLKKFWDRCSEIIEWDYESLKINQHKF